VTAPLMLMGIFCSFFAKQEKGNTICVAGSDFFSRVPGVSRHATVVTSTTTGLDVTTVHAFN
jgi:hypothetical protein